jgi:hypothetical protein
MAAMTSGWSRSMLDAIAGVGIVSLIDEATGYQTIREHGALSRLYERMARLLAHYRKTGFQLGLGETLS